MALVVGLAALAALPQRARGLAGMAAPEVQAGPAQ
jgi:hypothetical protein